MTDYQRVALLVSGFADDPENMHWKPIRSMLKDDPDTLIDTDYPLNSQEITSQKIFPSGNQLYNYIDQDLEEKYGEVDEVAVISHSKGGLVSRWPDNIDKHVMISTPHNGTDMADIFSSYNGAECLRQESDCLKELNSRGSRHETDVLNIQVKGDNLVDIEDSEPPKERYREAWDNKVVEYNPLTEIVKNTLSGMANIAVGNIGEVYDKGWKTLGSMEPHIGGLAYPETVKETAEFLDIEDYDIEKIQPSDSVKTAKNLSATLPTTFIRANYK